MNQLKMTTSAAGDRAFRHRRDLLHKSTRFTRDEIVHGKLAN
jgi:hypothetical protein